MGRPRDRTNISVAYKTVLLSKFVIWRFFPGSSEGSFIADCRIDLSDEHWDVSPTDRTVNCFFSVHVFVRNLIWTCKFPCIHLTTALFVGNKNQRSSFLDLPILCLNSRCCTPLRYLRRLNTLSENEYHCLFVIWHLEITLFTSPLSLSPPHLPPQNK